MNIEPYWGPCYKCGNVTSHTTAVIHDGGGISGRFECTRCNPQAAEREVNELKQRILRLEERIAELQQGA